MHDISTVPLSAGSMLLYADVWDPHHLGHIEALEKVQRFALKMCTKSWDSSYEDMLTFCNLPTLCQRRHVLNLTFLYQVDAWSFYFS